MRVKLEWKFVWTCPTCQNRNEHGGKTIRDPEELAELKELLGPDDIGGSFCEYPSQVACVKCESVFETIAPEPE
jgi:hypothetical protein